MPDDAPKRVLFLMRQPRRCNHVDTRRKVARKRIGCCLGDCAPETGASARLLPVQAAIGRAPPHTTSAKMMVTLMTRNAVEGLPTVFDEAFWTALGAGTGGDSFSC